MRLEPTDTLLLIKSELQISNLLAGVLCSP
jgi:hypothetical protein